MISPFLSNNGKRIGIRTLLFSLFLITISASQKKINHNMKLLFLFVLCCVSQKLCHTDTECDSQRSFCHAEWHCTEAMRCMPSQIDPCVSLRGNARRLSLLYNISLGVVCSDSLERCIALHYCLVDKDCQKPCYRCIRGVCQKTTVCPSEEDIKANIIVEDGSSPSITLLAVVIGIFTVVGVIVVIGLLFLGVQNAREELASRRSAYAIYLSNQ